MLDILDISLCEWGKKLLNKEQLKKKSMEESWLLSMSCVPSGAFQVVLVVKKKKNSPAKAGDVRDTGSIPGSEDLLKKGTATHSSILTWRIPWTEESSGLRSIGAKNQMQLKWLCIAHSTHFSSVPFFA